MAKFWKLKFFNPQEDEINFDDFTKFAFLMCRIVFFKFMPLSKSATLKEKVGHYARVSFVRITLVLCAVAFYLMVCHTVVNADDLSEAAKSFPNVCSVILMSLKGLASFLRRDDIWSLFHEFVEMNDRRAGKNRKYQVKKYFDEYHFYMISYATVFVLISLPILYAAIPFIVNGTMKMPIQYWFPFNPYNHKIFPFVLLWTFFIAYVNLMFLLGTDSLLYALLTVVAMEFEILKSDLLEISSIPENERSEKIKDLIDHHNKLLDISEKLQNIYSLTFLLALAISSLILCTVLFQLSIISFDLEAYSFYVPYVFLLGGQTYLLCLFGQKLVNASESVADGVFHCGWENFDDIILKKQLILIILRAQRAQRLSAMHFTDVTLASFTSVNKHAINIDRQSLIFPNFSFYRL